MRIGTIGLWFVVCCAGCGGGADHPLAPSALPSGPGGGALVSGGAAAGAFGSAVLVGAGDIAICNADGQHAATASLLDAIGGTVLALGDNAYMSGTAREFAECYGPTWGRHRERTRPVPGNHEYESAGAAPYYAYFGANAGPPGLGYYSYEAGGWHVVALNSNIGVGGGSAQAAWLRADLAAHPARCTVAYWHHPRFSSGRHGSQGQMAELWRILQEAGAELVLSGHDHIYERFAPQDVAGAADPARGMRQFVVGTGGARPYAVAAVQPNSEVRLSTHGVLKLTLSDDAYQWEFVSLAGVADAGSGVCH